MRTLLVTALLITLISTLHAQGRRYRFIGLTPGVQVDVLDPYYPVPAYNINVAPLVFQTPINTVTDFKVMTSAIYSYGGLQGISQAGLQVIFPRFFSGKERFSEKSQGWYLGPFVMGNRNFLDNYYDAAPGLEFGKYGEGKGAFALTFNIQAGASYRIQLNRENAIVPYVGINLGFGLWLKDQVSIRGGAI